MSPETVHVYTNIALCDAGIHHSNVRMSMWFECSFVYWFVGKSWVDLDSVSCAGCQGCSINILTPQGTSALFVIKVGKFFNNKALAWGQVTIRKNVSKVLYCCVVNEYVIWYFMMSTSIPKNYSEFLWWSFPRCKYEP